MIGGITIVAVGALALWGNRPFFRTMTIGFIVGTVGVIVLLIVLIASNNKEFVESFNRFAESTTGMPTYLDNIMKIAAEKFGFVKSSPRFWSGPTLLAMAFAFQPLGFSVWSAYLSGEIKNAKSVKVHAGAMVGSLLFTGISLIIIGALAVHVLGYNFLGATGLFYHNFAELEGGIINNAYFFVALMTKNPVFQLLIGLSLMAWTFLYIQPSLAMVSRCLFAWSVDGLAPRGLKHVNKKSHVPDVAIITACIIAIAFLAKFCWPGRMFSIYGANAFIGGGTVTFAVVALSAIVFPFAKKTKNLYELSPVKWKLGSFPFMSLCGIISVVFLIYITVLYLSVPDFGVSTVPSILFLCLLYAVGFVWYVIAWTINKGKGIDTEKVLREIPQD